MHKSTRCPDGIGAPALINWTPFRDDSSTKSFVLHNMLNIQAGLVNSNRRVLARHCIYILGKLIHTDINSNISNM